MVRLRAFVAIDIPDSVREEIRKVQAQLKRHHERISWTKPENIHLTLKFLGYVDENLISAIVTALQDLAKDVPAFRFDVSGLGAFPNMKHPRVLWAGITNSEVDFPELAKKIDDVLNPFGFSKESRKFTPHLTVGRVKAPLGEPFKKEFETVPLQAGSVNVEEFLLMRSELKPAGAVYTPLGTMKLGLKG